MLIGFKSLQTCTFNIEFMYLFFLCFIFFKSRAPSYIVLSLFI